MVNVGVCALFASNAQRMRGFSRQRRTGDHRPVPRTPEGAQMRGVRTEQWRSALRMLCGSAERTPHQTHGHLWRRGSRSGNRGVAVRSSRNTVEGNPHGPGAALRQAATQHVLLAALLRLDATRCPCGFRRVRRQGKREVPQGGCGRGQDRSRAGSSGPRSRGAWRRREAHGGRLLQATAPDTGQTLMRASRLRARTLLSSFERRNGSAKALSDPPDSFGS